MADLADLDTEVPAPVAGALHLPSKAQALGWLFVSEGSKLGAAFLIKRAVAWA
jgi:heme oxygenase